jgi:hypothetical protein
MQRFCLVRVRAMSQNYCGIYNCITLLNRFSAIADNSGKVTFDQIIVSDCIQQDLVLRFSAAYLTNVASAPFDVFMEPNLPNITGLPLIHMFLNIFQQINCCTFELCTSNFFCFRGSSIDCTWFSSEFYCWRNRSVRLAVVGLSALSLCFVSRELFYTQAASLEWSLYTYSAVPEPVQVM